MLERERIGAVEWMVLDMCEASEVSKERIEFGEDVYGEPLRFDL
jgi:hypothetical protein